MPFKDGRQKLLFCKVRTYLATIIKIDTCYLKLVWRIGKKISRTPETVQIFIG